MFKCQYLVALATKIGEGNPETRTGIRPNFVGDVENFSGSEPVQRARLEGHISLSHLTNCDESHRKMNERDPEIPISSK
jgi:hypothetical protein